MPEQALQDAALDARHGLIGRKRVPHIVQSEILDAGAAHSALKGDADLVGVEAEQPAVEARRQLRQSFERYLVQMDMPNLTVFSVSERGNPILRVDRLAGETQDLVAAGTWRRMWFRRLQPGAGSRISISTTRARPPTVTRSVRRSIRSPATRFTRASNEAFSFASRNRAQNLRGPCGHCLADRGNLAERLAGHSGERGARALPTDSSDAGPSGTMPGRIPLYAQEIRQRPFRKCSFRDENSPKRERGDVAELHRDFVNSTEGAS